MATDFWPQEEGYIVEGSPNMMCLASGAIAEFACVKLSATATGVVTVAASAAAGDSIGVALRSAADGQMLPVCFEGICKMIADATITLGQSVQSYGANTAAVVDSGGSEDHVGYGDTAGTKKLLGTALHASADQNDDEILVWVGRW